jgi:ABC-type glycerol-3-phosphate transport system substrate-binding protein
MKRRWFIPAAVLAAMALGLSACGGDDGGGGGTEAGDGTVTVFSLWGGSEQEAF